MKRQSKGKDAYRKISASPYSDRKTVFFTEHYSLRRYANSEQHSGVLLSQNKYWTNKVRRLTKGRILILLNTTLNAPSGLFET